MARFKDRLPSDPPKYMPKRKKKEVAKINKRRHQTGRSKSASKKFESTIGGILASSKSIYEKERQLIDHGVRLSLPRQVAVRLARKALKRSSPTLWPYKK